MFFFCVDLMAVKWPYSADLTDSNCLEMVNAQPVTSLEFNENKKIM